MFRSAGSVGDVRTIKDLQLSTMFQRDHARVFSHRTQICVGRFYSKVCTMCTALSWKVSAISLFFSGCHRMSLKLVNVRLKIWLATSHTRISRK